MRLPTSSRLILAALMALPLAVVARPVSVSVAKEKKLAPASKPSPMLQKPVEDAKLTCKQLSGRVQVAILQIRDYSTQSQSSGFSRSLQSVFSSTVGTSPHGVDPEGRHAAELQQLQDYNQRLVAMGCRSYNLDQELQNRDPNEIPSATVPAIKANALKSAKQPANP